MLRAFLERRRMRRLSRAEAPLSAAEQRELARLRDEHGTIHIGAPESRMYDAYEADSKKPRY